MRRAAATVAVILILLCVIPAHAAASGFYAEYTPPTERGSLFTVDICARQYTSAAVFRLDYDSGLVAYRSVEADRDSSTVKAEADESGVKLVFCDSEGLSGRLCRLTLKWIGEGTVDFILSMIEGVDDRLEMFDPAPDLIFTESFGGDTESGSSGSVSRKTSSSTRETRSGSKSSKTYITDDESSTGSERRPLLDLSHSHETDYFLLGVCAAALAAMLIVLGFILGRRIKNKKPSKKEDSPEEAPNDEDEEDQTDDENTATDENPGS